MIETAVMIFFPILMVFAACSDLFTMTISNRVSLALVAGFPPLAIFLGIPASEVGLHVLCGLGVLALTFTFFSFGWIGGGDAKLAAATSVWLGWELLAEYGLLSAIVGGGLTLALLFVRRWPLPALLMRRAWIARLHDPRTGIPYGIALAAAGLVIYPESLIWLRSITA